MGDLNTFAIRIRAIGRQVERGVNRVVRKAALAADRNLVFGTPVDTGRARSNWVVTVGTPSREQLSPYAPGEAGSTGAENARAAFEQGQAEIGRRLPGQDIFITNNLPYISRLNEGYSAQAPAGFVQEAIHQAAQTVRQSRVLTDGD